jgi:FlaA1/EpsC-like NDP-sugar epimerase
MKKNGHIFIIGAGFAGQAIYREITDKKFPGSVVAFLDDDPEKIGTFIDGKPVLGPVRTCAGILKLSPLDEAIIAIPSATRIQLANLYNSLQKAGFSRIRILPTISQIISGHPHLVQARDIDPQDLLGRTPIFIDLRQALSYLRNKRVLVTGAGGSIGSELTRQLLSAGVQRLYLFGHGENSIYHIESELRLLQDSGVGERTSVVPVIGDLQDRDFMFFILKRLQADVIFHCAAHKHVPMMEKNPVEAVKNNVFGTKNLIEAAEEARMPKFVLISTDKAVQPGSVYGATKSLSERLVLKERGKGLDFMVVRFGNVLGSRGSIVPLFKKQILNGGPVTVTDPEMKRFFMTIPEAASLVLQTGGTGDNGGLYMLDMGEPIRILDMAHQMIGFYGYEPDEVPVVYTGLRPGEKLEERLWDDSETPQTTPLSRILRLEKTRENPADLDHLIERLRPVCFRVPGEESSYRNRRLLREILSEQYKSMQVPPDEHEY